jgi:hypothetical protein
MEKAGKPAVAITAASFERDAMNTARAFGMRQFRCAVVPEVLTSLSADRIEQLLPDVIDRIIEVLTTESADERGKAPATVRPAQRLTIEASDAYEAFELMNRQFLDQEWGDGLPLIPPTPGKVDEMLKGTNRAPGDLVTVLAPGSGLATVEMIAINAVMAGCEPIHLPVLIAACEAYTAMGDGVRTMATSTGAHAPLMVINGPIAETIGINSKRCALGPGKQSRHNIVLGRALRLIMINVGNCRPGHMDMDTIGSARKFGMCVAENESESPWAPYHVEKGFDKDASTVTLFSNRNEVDVADLENITPEGILNSLATYSAIPGGEYLTHRHSDANRDYAHLLMMCPEHAGLCGQSGWSKTAVKQYVYQRCRISANRFVNKCRNIPDMVRPQWKWLLKLPESELERMMLPIMENASDIEILVVGGPAGKSMTYGCNTTPSTAVIKDCA